MSLILASHVQHIDNGGILCEISVDTNGFVEVSFDTEYFGYPSIETRLKLNAETSPELLRMIGQQFYKAADKLECTSQEIE